VNVVSTSILGFYAIYARHTGRDYDTIEKTLDRDHFMSAEESKEFGIVDYVIVRRPDEMPLAESN
jgi:ATP-dependent Clp protease protease subunit